MTTTVQRTAVLTGATSERGIGLTTARRYASQGWGVVILDLDGEKSAKVAAEIGNEFNVPASPRRCRSWTPPWSSGTR
jgi:2-hydroxycyclohexanecarboxyl-CoA dehydrogenase